jgi:hypothetical protein
MLGPDPACGGRALYARLSHCGRPSRPSSLVRGAASAVRSLLQGTHTQASVCWHLHGSNQRCGDCGRILQDEGVQASDHTTPTHAARSPADRHRQRPAAGTWCMWRRATALYRRRPRSRRLGMQAADSRTAPQAPPMPTDHHQAPTSRRTSPSRMQVGLLLVGCRRWAFRFLARTASLAAVFKAGSASAGSLSVRSASRLGPGSERGW